MQRYLIVIEPTPTGFSAFSPDVAGCVATGATETDTEANMREALAFHLDRLREEGASVPEPGARATYVEVAG